MRFLPPALRSPSALRSLFAIPTLLALLFTAFALAANAQQAAPATAPQPELHTDRPADTTRVLKLPNPDDDSFTFAVYGDRTGGPASGIKILAQAVDDTNLFDPDLVMTVGDLINGYNRAPEWMKQMEEFHATMDKLDMPWFPVAGNHDVYWRGPKELRPPLEHEALYEKHFGPFWYWFEHKTCGFLVLYTDEGVPGGTRAKAFRDPEQHRFSPKQLAFLETSLTEMKHLNQVFVFLHHPRWRSNYPGANWHKTIHPLLVKAGNVKAAFAGHIHQMTYGGRIDGIEYYSLATVGGGLPGSLVSPVTGYLHHYNIVTVRSNDFHMVAVPVGQAIDPKTFTPEYESGIRAVRNLRPSFDGAVAFGDNASADGRIIATCTNATIHPLEIFLEPDATTGLIFAPDHATSILEPGQSRRFAFGVRKDSGDFDKLRAPRIKFRYDLLFKQSRLSFAERALTLPVRLKKLPPLPAGENNSLELRGKPDCLRIDPGSFALPDGPMTLEAWIRPSKKQSAVVIAKTESSEYNIALHDGYIAYVIHLGGAYQTVRDPEPLPLDDWTHIAGVFDGSELRLYRNGNKVASAPASGARKMNKLPLFLGADTDGRGQATRHFTGGLDDVRLSKLARYSDAFKPIRRHELDPNTVLLFHLDHRLGPFVPGANGIHAMRLGRAEIQ